jgi:hypothetical protein
MCAYTLYHQYEREKMLPTEEKKCIILFVLIEDKCKH